MPRRAPPACSMVTHIIGQSTRGFGPRAGQLAETDTSAPQLRESNGPVAAEREPGTGPPPSGPHASRRHLPRAAGLRRQFA